VTEKVKPTKKQLGRPPHVVILLADEKCQEARGKEALPAPYDLKV
jgi:hypothetical protein